MKKISEESVEIIRQHISELDLKFPLDDEDAGYKIFQLFTTLDACIGTILVKGDEVNRKFIDDVGRGVMEFNNPEEPIDYEDLERRLKPKRHQSK